MAEWQILLVDDEAMLLDLLGRYMERLGYHVSTAADPEAALALFERDPQGFDLVVTDLTLQSMNGEEMLAKMRELNPQQRGLIASGYAHEPRLPGVGFLQKPFLPKMLAAAVELALAR